MNHSLFSRRQCLLGLGSVWAMGASAAVTPRRPGARVVVVGGGFGGATAAKYLRLLDPSLEVVLVEPEAVFVSCPMSNLVLGGHEQPERLVFSYDRLQQRHGVLWVQDRATHIDVERRRVGLARGEPLAYDRLVLSPGVDFLYAGLAGLETPSAQAEVLHAWKAGAQTLALRRQLEALPEGGVFAIHIPKVPYRCPPGPYERVCQVVSYFKAHKPRAKILVLDANPEVVSKKDLFLQAWREHGGDMVEYRPHSELWRVDAGLRQIETPFESVRADVLNVIPPQAAGGIARSALGLSAAARWIEVDFRSFETLAVPGVHVLGDATASAPGMPKSAFMANNQAKVAAEAIVAALHGQETNPAPILANTCYSFVGPDAAMHVASVHKWDPEKRTVLPVPGAGGLSLRPSALEAQQGRAWAANIWADTFS